MLEVRAISVFTHCHAWVTVTLTYTLVPSLTEYIGDFHICPQTPMFEKATVGFCQLSVTHSQGKLPAQAMALKTQWAIPGNTQLSETSTNSFTSPGEASLILLGKNQ